VCLGLHSTHNIVPVHVCNRVNVCVCKYIYMQREHIENAERACRESTSKMQANINRAIEKKCVCVCV